MQSKILLTCSLVDVLFLFCFVFFQIIIVVINERTCWCLTVCCLILKKMYNNDCQFLSKTHEMAIIIWTVLTDLKRKQTRIMNVLELERLMGSRTGCVSDREGLRTLTCCARRVSAETEDLLTQHKQQSDDTNQDHFASSGNPTSNEHGTQTCPIRSRCVFSPPISVTHLPSLFPRCEAVKLPPTW